MYLRSLCIVNHMKRLESLAATKPFWASAGVELADMPIATPAQAQLRSYAMHGRRGAGYLCGLPHESEISHRTTVVAARTEAIAFGAGAGAALVELKPRRRPSEDEIVRAAITVIFVSLGAIMALGAAAILTMG
jgi:hypothetical protein